MVKELKYASCVDWTEKKKAVVTFSDKDKNHIEVAVAPEFLGHRGIITPEDLFVSSVNTCMMSYFLNVCEKMRAKFVSYSSSAEGILSEKGIDFIFSVIHLSVKVVVESDRDKKKVRRALDMASSGCFIANSLKTEVTVTYDVEKV